MKLRNLCLILLAFTACTGPPVEKEKGGDDVVIINGATNSSTNNGTTNDDPVLTECGPGRTLCGERCVDTNVDGEHCGQCDNPCAEGTVCSEGACAGIPDDCRMEGECPTGYFCDENTGLCEAGCSSNTECPDGSYCELESHSCLCSDEGNVVCGDQCVAESPSTCGSSCETCPPIANGTATCTDGQCGQECNEGYMMCDGTCAACPTGEGVVSVGCLGNQCVATECEGGYEICDGTCADCPVATGDESLGCDGAQCVITDCPAGTRLCDGTCAECPTDPNGSPTCQGQECVLVCSSGYHSCGGEYCAQDGDVDNCGSSCSYCDDDLNGTATCNAGQCELECDAGYRECQDACAECPDGPGVTSTMCAGANCVVNTCAAGYQPCSNGCCTTAPDGTAHDYDETIADISIAVDSRGYPHIAFGSATDNAIRYVWWDGTTWDEEWVRTGWHVDIEVDATDTPHIALWKRNPDQTWYGRREITSWALSEVDRVFSDVGMTPDLELVAGTPHIAYYDLEYDNLYYAIRDGNDWENTKVASTGNVGFSPSMVVSGGVPHIVYRDSTNERTMHAIGGASWSTNVADDSMNSGAYSSLAADSTDTLHLAIQVDGGLNDTDSLHYLDRSASSWSSPTEIAAEGARPSLTLDGSDSPVVVYWNPYGDVLRMTKQSNGWTPVDLDSSTSIGEQVEAVYSPATGKIHVAYFDYPNRDIKYLTFDP